MQNISNSFFELLNKIQEKKKGDDIQQYFAEVADYLFKHVAIIVPIHVREMWASSSGIIAVWTSALKVVRKRSTSVASL